ncbi:MAG TPA: hypothetical protein DCS85_11920 [Verrucomicrobiales bacterium]|nr:hypothetical protein [Verrucomicrobiales bacterium]
MGKAEKKMVGIFGDLGRLCPKLVVETSQGGSAVLFLVELGIEIGHRSGIDMFNAQIRIPRALFPALGGERDGAEKGGVVVDPLPQGVLEEARTLVDTAQIPQGGTFLAVDLHGMVGGVSNRFQNDCGSWLPGVKGSHRLSGGTFDHAGE